MNALNSIVLICRQYMHYVAKFVSEQTYSIQGIIDGRLYRAEASTSATANGSFWRELT